MTTNLTTLTQPHGSVNYNALCESFSLNYQGRWKGGIAVINKADMGYAYNGKIYTPVLSKTPFVTSDSFNQDLILGRWEEKSFSNLESGISTLEGLNNYRDNNMRIALANMWGSITGHVGNVAVMLIGDSITDGVGAINQEMSYKNLLYRSLGRITEHTYGCNPITNNLSNYFSNPFNGANTNGSPLSKGAMESRVLLTNGKQVTITGKQASYFDLVYDAQNSSGSVNLYLNDKLLGTKAIISTSVPSIQSTFAIGVTPSMTKPTDIIRFEIVGQMELVGVQVLKKAPSGIMFYGSHRSGWAYQNFVRDEFIDETVALTNRNTIGRTYILNLGTNNLYNPTYRQSPTALMELILNFMNKIQAKQQNANFILSIPPKADESRWGLLAGYKYEDYVEAYLSFAKRWGLQLIRHDLVDYVGNNLYMDGVHPSDAGHIQMARTICDTLGVPFSPNDTAYDEVESGTVNPWFSTITYATGCSNLTQDPIVCYKDNVTQLDAVVKVEASAPISTDGLKQLQIGSVHPNISSGNFDRFWVVPADNGFYRARLSGVNLYIQGVEEASRPSWVGFSVSWAIRG